MDLCKKFLLLKATDLIARLSASGFSRADAERFIPAACQRVMAVFAGPHFSGYDSITNAERFEHLMGHIDVARLASSLNIDLPRSRSGLQQLIPDLVGFLKLENPDTPLGPGLTGWQQA